MRLVKRGFSFEAEAFGDYTYDSGFKEAILLLHRSKVDAIICGNDVMAIGARDAARRVLGRTTPDDIAIVGQDGIAMAAWDCNDLTTLCLDHVAFINAVVDLIERHDAGPAWTAQHNAHLHGALGLDGLGPFAGNRLWMVAGSATMS
jgi:DNA-binding LacI/PurR family transcriptional regulator